MDRVTLLKTIEDQAGMVIITQARLPRNVTPYAAIQALEGALMNLDEDQPWVNPPESA